MSTFAHCEKCACVCCLFENGIRLIKGVAFNSQRGSHAQSMYHNSMQIEHGPVYRRSTLHVHVRLRFSLLCSYYRPDRQSPVCLTCGYRSLVLPLMPASCWLIVGNLIYTVNGWRLTNTTMYRNNIPDNSRQRSPRRGRLFHNSIKSRSRPRMLRRSARTACRPHKLRWYDITVQSNISQSIDLALD